MSEETVFTNPAFSSTVRPPKASNGVDFKLNESRDERKSHNPAADRLRKKLQFFFSNPVQRCRKKEMTLYSRIPIKLLVQLLKVIIVTTQLVYFGYERAAFSDFLDRTTLAAHHLLLKRWIPQYETMPYPPATGVYAIYDTLDLKEHINFAVNRFYAAPKIAMGSYYFDQDNGTDVPMRLCLTFYKFRMFYSNDTLVVDPTTETSCYPTTVSNQDNQTSAEEFTYDIDRHLEEINHTQTIDRLVAVELKYNLNSVRLDLRERQMAPQCFRINGTVYFDNTDRNGQTLVSIQSSMKEFRCRETFPVEDRVMKRNYALAVVTIVLNLASLFFSCGAIFRACKLMLETRKYFQDHLDTNLPKVELMEFIKFWDVLIIINDIFTISGSLMKMLLMLENAEISSSKYDICSFLLGVGCLLVWVGVLRYLSFAPKFNLFFLIIKKAAHNVIRYSMCVLWLYGGFVLCGWVIIGPYHIKFRELSKAAECLFSLVNGDEIYVTFMAVVAEEGSFIWFFTRIFFYTYIGLFTIVALNLFIAIFMDTYDTVKRYSKEGFPKSNLEEFVDQVGEPIYTGDCSLACFASCAESDTDE